MRVAAVLALVAAFLVAPPAYDAQQLLAPQTLAARDAPIFARSDGGKVTSVALSPDSAKIEIGVDSALITAVVQNQFLTDVKQAVQWSVNAADTAKVTLANIADRSVTVVPRAVGMFYLYGKVGPLSDSTRVTVIAAATLTSVVVAPTQWSMASATTKQFTATARWSDGTTRAVSPTWAATGGTITQAGLYTAGATGGTFAVTASSAGKTGSAAITITAALPTATMTALVLNPPSASMNVNGAQQFTASATWSDGNSHPFTPAWTATGGTVTSVGYYTAGAVIGTFRVIATANSRADTAAITVNPAPTATSAGCPTSGYLRLVNVATAAQLLTAVGAALPGDQIRMASNPYTARPNITRSGTQANPITLCGPRTAVINTTGSWITQAASWWVHRGYTTTGGTFGIAITNGTNNIIDSLRVTGIGQEGIVVKGSSSPNTASFNTVRYNTIDNLGTATAYFGEAIYVGDGGCGCFPANDNTIEFNTIGPNVRAEAVQINIGTSRNVARDNVIDASGFVLNPATGTTVAMWMGGTGSSFLRNTMTGVPSGVVGMGFYTSVNGAMHLNRVTGTYVRAYQVDGGSGNVLSCDNTASGGTAFSNVACTP